jgi:hypothetical protein
MIPECSVAVHDRGYTGAMILAATLLLTALAGAADDWRTSYDAFVAELQHTAESRGLSNADLAARFQGERVTWDGELKGVVAHEGRGIFLEIGFPQRRLRLRDGSMAFIGFVVDTAGTHIKQTESKAVTAIRIPARDVLPSGLPSTIPGVLRVSFILKRVWIQPPDPRGNPKLGDNYILAVEGDNPQLVTPIRTKAPAAQ